MVSRGFKYWTIAVWVYTLGAWITNLVKLLRMDFEPFSLEQILHILGLIPIISWFTCWI